MIKVIGHTERVRIERGVPTDEELAALVGALLVARQPLAGHHHPAVSRWSSSARPGYAHRDGRPTRPGRTAWSAAALPR